MWSYTPAQALAFVNLGKRDRRSERARLLELTAMAFRSDGKSITKKIEKDWGDD